MPDIEAQKTFYDDRWTKASQKRRLPQHLQNRLFGIQRLLDTFKLSRGRILEIGAGLGYISNLASRYGEVDGIELSAKAVVLAQAAYPQCTFIQGDIFERKLAPAHYDLAITSEVIEHIPTELRGRFIEICWTALKQHGHLILTTPNKSITDHIYKEQPIENHFTAEDLRALLHPWFEIRHFSTVQNFLPRLCNRSRLFQVVRLLVYEVLKLRSWFEDPLRNKQKGFYFIVLARRKERRTT